ncbi:class I SAM-dependent methyltransferase [Eisenbergiella porci]|uniref:class I SAM-dependent methyltransferase n=1 Tax=Eisenbergiella porci TaxID=2652274 RepID=UPI002A806C80|nr:methyltransferase domain-containing protein [Eisenbergiella porci]
MMGQEENEKVSGRQKEKNEVKCFGMSPERIAIASQKSLVHLGSLDSFDITEGGKQAARCILDYLEKGEEQRLRRAVDIYEELIPNENFGGEYTALEWLCRLWIAPEEDRERFLSVPEVEGFYGLLAADDFRHLHRYLKLKYHFEEIDRRDTTTKDYLRFLEDFILFNNPDRIRWEKTRENLEKFGIREGMHIADVGAGPGYFSFKFAQMTGKTGKVYAIETNPRHLQYLEWYKKKNLLDNLEPVTSSFNGIGLAEDIRVDMVFMCSLYHNVYAAFTDEERDEFVGSIRRALKPDGRFILVDNDLVEEGELPYHGPYISRELLISQLSFYGFAIVDHYQFTPQRYVLIFRLCEPVRDTASTEGICRFEEGSTQVIRVHSPAALIRYRIIGTSTSGYTLKGKQAALLMYEAVVKKEKALLVRAVEEYGKLIPTERIGDDYTALLWFCQYLLMEEKEQESLLEDCMVREYHHFFADNDYEILKKYLRNKYDFKVPMPEVWDSFIHEFTGGEVEAGVLNEWNELLIFNNPNRFLWEKTEEMLGWLNIKEGEAVADIGCGSGFFSYRFKELAGENGMVYATEINEDALSYMEKLNRKYDLGICTRISALNDLCLEENSVDTVFMCSMYHATYIASIEFVKDSLIESVRKALRPGGRWIIVDNDITPPGVPAYYGPGIARELIIAQLKFYGFRLKASVQFVPQRYILQFEDEG